MKLEFDGVQYDVRFNHFDMKVSEIQAMLREPSEHRCLRPLQTRISTKRPTTNEILHYVRTLIDDDVINFIAAPDLADEIESFIIDPLYKVTKARIIALPYFRKSTYWKDRTTQRITESDAYSVRDVTIPDVKSGTGTGDEAVLSKSGKLERFDSERYIDSGFGLLVSEGFAFCSPDDEFDRGFGRQVALERAVQSSNRLVLSDMEQSIWDEYFKMTGEKYFGLTHQTTTVKSWVAIKRGSSKTPTHAVQPQPSKSAQPNQYDYRVRRPSNSPYAYGS